MIFGSAIRLLKKEGLNSCVSDPSPPLLVKPKNTLLEKWDIVSVFIAEQEEVLPAIACLLATKNTIGLDIETNKLLEFKEDKRAGLDPRKSAIRTIQLYDGEATVFVFDIMKLGGVARVGTELWEKPMIAHNAIFELSHLLHTGFYPKKLQCSLLADRVLNGNRRELRPDLGLSRSATLKDLAKELLGLEISKELQVSNWSQENLTPEQIEYAALDAVLTVKIFQIQTKLLSMRNLAKSYMLLRDVQFPIARMQLNGIGFDVKKHRELRVLWLKESLQLGEFIFNSIGKKLNLNSSKQMGAWLKEVLTEKELENWGVTPKGALATSTPILQQHSCVHEAIPHIVAYRHLKKRLSSFGETLYKFIDESKNRLFGSFSLGTTATGRMASNSPNMQNMPREDFRHLFCAQDGYILIGLDYSQQELRVAALIAKDPALLRVYENGEDAHTNTASLILKLPIEQVTKNHRQLAKALNFGLLYGQGAKGLAVYSKRSYGVEMSETEAKQHQKAFFKIYSGLKNWQNQTGRVVEITKKIKTPGGRERDFSREILGYRYTIALNHPIQGAAAEITLNALKRIAPYLCEDCRLVNVIHDEILLEVREDRAQFYAEEAKMLMEQAFLDVFPESGPYLKGLVEAKVGKNWAEAK